MCDMEEGYQVEQEQEQEEEQDNEEEQGEKMNKKKKDNCDEDHRNNLIKFVLQLESLAGEDDWMCGLVDLSGYVTQIVVQRELQS